MEGAASHSEARRIMGPNFLGPEEINCTGLDFLYNSGSRSLPSLPFKAEFLQSVAESHILIFGYKRTFSEELITLEFLRSKFSAEDFSKAPRFYSQDWYVKERFFLDEVLDNKWYLIKKKSIENLNGENPEVVCDNQSLFPKAILVAYTFFIWYFHKKGEILWKNNYIWCSDIDSRGDRIYVGRYSDVHGLSRDGFSIHRHLKLSSNHSFVDYI
jgi:hypothetical protein